MGDDLAALINTRKPTPERPLLGLTVLVVEDSRYACEAMRLLCLRSGARIRRADSLAAAHRHLATYRPAVVIVDMGLPDGSGSDLIGDLARAEPRVPVLIATSAEPQRAAEALAAGADGFLAKPVTRLAEFQEVILACLPPEARPDGLRQLSAERIRPDALALNEDLALAADRLAGAERRSDLGYLAQFLASIATSSGDAEIRRAAGSVQRLALSGGSRDSAIRELSGLVETRRTGTGPI